MTMQINKYDPEKYNPGEQLQVFLRSIFPTPQEFREGGTKENVISYIDWVMGDENKLQEAVYCSILNFLTRRLILLGRQHLEIAGGNKELARSSLNKFLKEKTRFSKRDLVIVLELIMESCFTKRSDKPTPNQKKSIRRNSFLKKENCYICGAAISEKNSEVEHHWPQSLGGGNHEGNLALSCKACNSRKRDFLNGFDFNFETLVNILENKTIATTEIDPDLRLSILLKNNSKCELCFANAKRDGHLRFIRYVDEDTWNFLNIGLYCEEHAERIMKTKKIKRT